MFSKTLLVSLSLLVSSTWNSVDSHGTMEPKPQYSAKKYRYFQNFPTGEFDAEIVSKELAGRWMSKHPGTIRFAKAFKKSKYKSLKQLIDEQVGYCINTVPTYEVDRSKFNGVFTWGNGRNGDVTKKGFVHEGPCELYLGSKLVYQNDDCKHALPQIPAKIPINWDDCGEKCVLSFYWLATHFKKLQSYQACMTVVNKNGSGNSNNNNNNNKGKQ